ncbi:GSCOCG00005569001-RA-CDS [Cotesia congregata]|nr:GSCOCG00005569001-RA-CDS [Cotesia congregata]
MSLAGLVAYDSSDESDNEDCPKENTTKNVEITISSDNLKNSKSIQNDIKSKLPEPRQKIQENDRLDSSNDVGNSSSSLFFNILPKPKNEIINEEIDEELDDIPVMSMKNITIEKPIKKIREPVKISIPSLSDYDDVEEPTKVIRKPQPSKGLPGVLANIPPPKSELISTKNMVPHVLTKKSGSVTSLALKPTQVKKNAQNHTQVNKQVEETKTSKALDAITYASDSSDEEDTKVSSKSGIDFFSLSEPVNLPISEQALASHLLPMPEKMEISNCVGETTNNVEEPEVNGQNQKTLTSTVMNLPRDEILMKNKAAIGPKLPVPEQEFRLDSEGNVAFDDKAIEYLCGKRGVKRKHQIVNETEIIDINGEDIKPDERDWLIKALTEEPVQRPVSLGSGPSGQSKKKHQITYLAHQAKAMELELKNQWAANKLARNQAKSKYGF